MTEEDVSLERFAHRLGIETVPDSWNKYWPLFRNWETGGKCASLPWQTPKNAAAVFDLPPECTTSLDRIYETIRTNDHLARFADFWHYVIYHLPEDIGIFFPGWPPPPEPLASHSRLFALAMMVSGIDHALANFAKTGVSEEITRATLGYIGRFTRDTKERRDEWGLEAVGWLRNYIQAKIFRLGRLTFMATKCNGQFRGYQNRKTGEIITLCGGALRYREDGLADGTNDVRDPKAWTPTLEIGANSIVGYPVSGECTALREPVTLKTVEWIPVMTPGDDCVGVHIAGGSPLLREECIDAYRQALEFFPRHYPQSRFTVFMCGSWLLDPGLAKILPPESNIAQFQKPYHLLPVPGNEAQAYDLVYGSPTADPATAPRNTQLRRAIAEYVAAGNKMRSTSGYITWEEAIAMTQEKRG